MIPELLRTLDCHPGAPSGAATVEVGLRIDGAGDWHLRYGGGGADTLAFPAPAVPGPADELWRHTCCELFVAATGASGYREFNFSPSGRWAIYDFDTYRHRAGAEVVGAPAMAFSRGERDWQLRVTVPASLLPAGAVEVAFCVVLEAAGGDISHWALHHPAGRPDFHDRRGFILHLP